MATIQVVTYPVTINEDGSSFTWVPSEDVPLDRYLTDVTNLAEVITRAKAQQTKFAQEGRETLTMIAVQAGRSPRGFKKWYQKFSPLLSDPHRKWHAPGAISA